MKKISLPALILVMVFAACGPASEDREQMHRRAKVFQDSIANIIRTSMAEAAAPGANQGPPPAVVDTSKKVAPVTPTVK